MRRPSSVRNAAGCYGIGLTPLDSTGGRERQMCRGPGHGSLARGAECGAEALPGTV